MIKQEILDRYVDIDNVFEIYTGDTLHQALSRITTNINNIIFEPHITKHRIYKTEYGYDGAYKLALGLFRLETDEEYTDRLQWEEELKELELETEIKKPEELEELEEKEEKAELARLLEKYGTPSK